MRSSRRKKGRFPPRQPRNFPRRIGEGIVGGGSQQGKGTSSPWSGRSPCRRHPGWKGGPGCHSPEKPPGRWMAGVYSSMKRWLMGAPLSPPYTGEINRWSAASPPADPPGTGRRSGGALRRIGPAFCIAPPALPGADKALAFHRNRRNRRRGKRKQKEESENEATTGRRASKPCSVPRF